MRPFSYISTQKHSNVSAAWTMLLLIVLVYSCKTVTPPKDNTTPTTPTDNGTTSTRPTTPYVADASFKTIAYFYGIRNPDSIDASKYKQLTHLNYAFIYPNKDGSLQPLANSSRFSQMYNIAQQNNIKFAITVGGPDSVFTAMASTSATRTVFVKAILQFAIDNKLNGVDIDWEYPKTSNSTATTFGLLVSELADSLHAWHKFISIAITPGLYAGAVRDAISTSVIGQADFFNIMIYDGIGWDTQDKNNHSTYSMVTTSINYWVNTIGMPKAKAIVGLPAYGKNAAGTSLSFRDLISKGANPSIDSANINGSVYYYNGINTIQKKVSYAKSNANGLMLWELYQDVNGSNSIVNTIYNALQ